MALSVRQQLIYWGIALGVLLVLLWFLGPVMAPFLAGGAIAYFLDPVADRLQRLGLSRVMAVAVISLAGALLAVLLLLALVPTLVQQTGQLLNATPEIFLQLQHFVTNRFPDLWAPGSPAHEALTALGNMLKAQGGAMVKTVFSSAFSSAITLLNMLMYLVVVPVVAFYLLLDWDRMLNQIDALVPREHLSELRSLAREIDKTLAAFVRGQLSVCLAVGTFYSIALMLAGLQFGLVVGVVSGAITFIPYIGSLVGGTLAIGLALYQFWGDWFSIGLVAAIFACGQFLEGNVITPRLVGTSVGLHPVWLLFALSAFGSVFGFVGMLVAVPVAAAIGVLARWATAKYRASLLYQGIDASEDR